MPSNLGDESAWATFFYGYFDAIQITEPIDFLNFQYIRVLIENTHVPQTWRLAGNLNAMAKYPGTGANFSLYRRRIPLNREILIAIPPDIAPSGYWIKFEAVPWLYSFYFTIKTFTGN